MMNILNIKELMNRGQYVISALLLSVCMFWGCDEYKDDMEGSFPEIPVLEAKIVVEGDDNAYIDDNNVYVDYKKVQVKIEIVSNQENWEVEKQGKGYNYNSNDYDSQDWFTVTTIKNEGQGTITVNLTKNSFDEERLVTIIVSSDKITRYIYIMQYAGHLTLDYPTILRSQSEIEAFCEEGYTEIHADLILGDASTYRGGSLKDGEVLKDIGGTIYVFKPSDITDLSFINEFRYYNGGLYVVNTKVNKVPTLSKNHYIYQLMLSNCELTTLFPQKSDDGLENITELDVSGNKLTNLNGIEYYRNVNDLNVSHNQLDDISHLQDAKSYLSKLDLSYNNVYDLNSLASFSYMEELNLSGLPINQTQVNELRSLFYRCIITTDDLKESESPRPAVITLEEYTSNEGTFYLMGELVTLGDDEVAECGFYIGTSDNISYMDKISVGTYYSQMRFGIEYRNDYDSSFYYVAYAKNKYGITLGEFRRIWTR